MPVTLPPSVRRALGDAASDDFEQWFQNALEERAVKRDEYREVLSRLDVIENDVGHLQGELEGFRDDVSEAFRRVDERFQRVDDRFQQVDDRFQQVDDRFQQMDDRFQQVDERFQNLEARLDQFYDRTVQILVRWTVGAIALFGTLITALIAIAEFF